MRTTLFLALVACGGGDDSQTSPTPSTTHTSTPPEPTIPEPQVIDLPTRDGITLVADYWQADPGSPAVVLLHMVPPSNDRTTWPLPFVRDLAAQGWSVIRLDRRGAGDSEGVAEEAYLGEKGRYDVEAAVLRLEADGAGDLAIIGASNGTTSMLDYTVWAPGEGLPPPVALGFMTGGTYTENNTPMSSLPAIPAVFTYSTAERDWSVAQQGLDPGSWTFLEYPAGDHGTRMFDAAPEVRPDLVEFFLDKLGGR